MANDSLSDLKTIGADLWRAVNATPEGAKAAEDFADAARRLGGRLADCAPAVLPRLVALSMRAGR
jgi:hypothetical protein